MLAVAAAGADYRSLDPAPVCVEGGILVTPLAVRGDPLAPSAWPDEIPVRLDDGRLVPGRVDWYVPVPDRREWSWTESGDLFTIVDQTEDPAALPMLVLETPEGYAGELGLPGGVVSPRWLRPAMPARRDPRAAAVDSPEALPDPNHPFEWFRWVLLAERLGDRPPPPTGDAAGRLAARHLAEVWRAAIARVERASPGVAAELRQRLTATCTVVDATGPEREIAAWIADPKDLRTLLSLAIDPERDDAEAMQSVLSWLRNEPQAIIWGESSQGDEVVFSVANPGADDLVLRCRWIEDDPIPIAVVVPRRTAQQVVLQRPVRDGVSSDGGVLIVEHGVHRRRLEFGQRPSPVRPPGGSLGPLHLPLTLAAERSGRVPLPPVERSGSAEIRRRQGGWELFVECFRPEAARFDELVVRLGNPESPAAMLQIPETGSVRSGAAEIHRASHPDRWRCRVVLPDSWLAASLVGTRAPGVGISVERRLTLADGSVERTATGPPLPPWNEFPPCEVRDLSRWPGGPGDRAKSADPGSAEERRILAP